MRKKFSMVGIRAEFSATKFRAEFCSDLKQSPKFLLFLLAVISIIYLQTGTLGQSGIIRKSWEFVKRSLLHERNYEEFLWNLTGEERRQRGILQEPPPWRRREQGSRRGILQDPPPWRREQGGRRGILQDPRPWRRREQGRPEESCRVQEHGGA